MSERWHAWIGTAALLLTTWGSMAAAWATLSERTEILRGEHVDHEERLRAIERSRIVDDKLEQLRVQMVQLQAEVSAMRSDFAAAKGDVVRISARRR